MLSGWSNTRVAVRCGWRAYSWQYSAGEAYESIGVNGNHVVLAIGVSRRQRGVTDGIRREEIPGRGSESRMHSAGSESDQFLNGLPRITSVGHPSAPLVTKQKLVPLT